MKKIFTIALAVAALAACNKSEVIEVPQGAAISFDNVFVDNATKATDLNAGNLTDFGVFGSVEVGEQNGMIFNNERVYDNGTEYVYNNTQYWIPSAQYYFTAIAPYQTGEGAAWTYTTANAHTGTIKYDAAKDLDLLFAYVKPAATAATIKSQPDAVAFTFNHMLSRVRFTFVNTIAEISKITMKITDVQITDAYQNGTLAIANGVAGNWSAENTFAVSFENAAAVIPGAATGVVNYETTAHHYILPVAKTVNVTFNLEIFQAGVSLGKYDRATTVALDPQKGASYDIKANLTHENALPNALYPIEFTVNKVEDWAEYADEATGTIN